MIVEIISIGTELILGDVIDSNSNFLAQILTTYGYDIHYINTVGDNFERLVTALKFAMNRADIIITTGGLGPTDDDLTRTAVANAAGCDLYKDPELLKMIKEYFKKRNYVMTDNNKKQACIPKGAAALVNNSGTAPGFILKQDEYIIISMPGVPNEMKNMFKKRVLPYLEEKNQKVIKSRILNFFNIGESTLETEIKDILDNQNNPTMALLAGRGEVKIRITAKSENEKKAKKLLDKQEKIIRERVGKYIYGINDKGLEVVVGRLLEKKSKTISLAESCTGGLVESRITDVPGCSSYFEGGLVTYSNQAKTNILNVNKKTIINNGAVSKETALEMAKNAKEKFDSDISLAVTGIAGPGGGSKEKPVGLIYIALYADDFKKVYQLNLDYNRNKNKWMTSQYALYYLYQYLLK